MLDRSLLAALLLSLAAAPVAGAQLVRRPPPAPAEPTGGIEITLPATMRGGDTVAGSVRLPVNAPAGGLRVTFSSDHPDLAGAVQAVTVPAFQRSAVFAVAATARRGTPAQSVTLTALTGGTSSARGSRAISVEQAAAAPVLVISNATPSPAAAAVARTGLPGVESRLEAAPPVADWQPRGQVSDGGRIVITGSDFRPADVSVRIGTRKLTLLEAGPTRIVARAPTATDPGMLDPHIRGPLSIGHAGGQLRTLEADYRVVDRWDGYQPAAVSTTRAGRGLSLTGAEPKKWFALFEVSLQGLPGDEFAGVPDGPTDASCGQELYVGGQPRALENGKLTLQVGMNFRLSALACSHLKLPLRLRYRDAPADVHTVVVDLGRVALRTIIRVENTQSLMDAGIITFSGGKGSGTCSGQVDSVRVGRLTIDGDVAFRVHDELVGTGCLWRLDQSLESGKWILREDGWTIHQFGWTHPDFPAGQRCHVQTQPRSGGDITGFYFERGQVFMGRDSRMMAPDSAMNVSLSCASTAQQLVTIGIDPAAPHSVTAQLDWVELGAPAGTTRWQQVRE